MTSEPGSARRPHPSDMNAKRFVLDYCTQRGLDAYSPSPISSLSAQIARTVFQEELEPPSPRKERQWILDDGQEFVVIPGSIGCPPSIEVELFENSMLATTHRSLHRVEVNRQTAIILEQTASKYLVLPYSIENEFVSEIREEYKSQGRVAEKPKHDFVLTRVKQVMLGTYGLMVYQGIDEAEKEKMQSIGDYLALKKKLEEIDHESIGSTSSNMLKAILLVNDGKTNGTIGDVRDFVVAGVNEGLNISVAAIDGMRIAVREWNASNPEEEIDFYQFAETEGRKWIDVIAAGHLDPTFALVRNLLGDTLKTDSPRFPPRTLGIGKYKGAPKLGLRISKLDAQNLLNLQTMYAADFVAVPRTKCPALGILVDELYSQTLNIYKKCMSS